MKLVEEYSGTGALTWRGEHYSTVRYSISRFQAMTAGGLPVPGLHRIEGNVDVTRLAQSSNLTGDDVTLHLEDGRTLKLTIKDPEGNVLAEGHGPSKCMCC